MAAVRFLRKKRRGFTLSKVRRDFAGGWDGGWISIFPLSIVQQIYKTIHRGHYYQTSSFAFMNAAKSATLGTFSRGSHELKWLHFTREISQSNDKFDRTLNTLKQRGFQLPQEPWTTVRNFTPPIVIDQSQSSIPASRVIEQHHELLSQQPEHYVVNQES